MSTPRPTNRPFSGINIRSLAQTLLKLAPMAAVAALTLAASVWTQWDTPDVLPAGDAYIHLVYARNLASSGELVFNPGIREGIGTTSILWVLILAGFHLLKTSPSLCARILGIVLLAVDGCLVYRLAWRVITKPAPARRQLLAACVALLAVLPGSLVWTAQNGMETIVFMTLGLLALEWYAAGWRIPLGVALGLLALTRSEGLLLCGVILAVDLIVHRRITKDMLKTAIPVVLLLLPWLAYLQWREGIPSTSSMKARLFYVKEEAKRIAPAFGALSWLWKLPVAPYIILWVAWLAFYTSGLASVFGPTLAIRVEDLGAVVEVPWLGVIIAIAIVIILGGSAFRWLWRRRRNLSIALPEHRLLVVIATWMILHNLTYAVLLPRTGSAGRYAPFNHSFFWITLGLGAYALSSRRTRVVAIVCVAALVGLSVHYWRSIFRDNTEVLLKTRIAAAQYVDQHVPPDETVGAIDIGIQRYFARQRVADMIGHVNNEILAYWQDGRSPADYVFDKQLCFVALHGPIQGAGLDIQHELGLDSDPRFDLVAEAVFAITPEEWLRGIGPVQSHLPAVYVYRVLWHGQPWCEEFDSGLPAP